MCTWRKLAKRAERQAWARHRRRARRSCAQRVSATGETQSRAVRTRTVQRSARLRRQRDVVARSGYRRRARCSRAQQVHERRDSSHTCTCRELAWPLLVCTLGPGIGDGRAESMQAIGHVCRSRKRVTCMVLSIMACDRSRSCRSTLATRYA